MDGHGSDQVSRRNYNNQIRVTSEESSIIMDHDDEEEVKRGPWTVEEDFTLINYVAHHGEGRWNSLARCAGLKRTGKSCRLRWLNYLRPDVRRGNITLEEQLLILELHSRWGNRWSKIAQHLPGRTDNEIKNYWRTRVEKHAKQLKCDVNSKQFKDAMRYLWMPRLIERIQATKPKMISGADDMIMNNSSTTLVNPGLLMGSSSTDVLPHEQSHIGTVGYNYAPSADLTESTCNNNYTTLVHQYHGIINNNNIQDNSHHHHHHHLLSNYADHDQPSTTAAGYFHQEDQNTQYCPIDDGDNFWDNLDDIWFLHHQFNLNF